MPLCTLEGVAMMVHSTKLTSSFAEAAVDLLAALAPSGLTPDQARFRAEVLWHIARCGEVGTTLRELERALRSAPRDGLRRVVAVMESSGMVEAAPVPSGPRGGRPTIRFRLAVPDFTSDGTRSSGAP